MGLFSISRKQAEKSLIHYKGFKGKSQLANSAIHDEMERLKSVESEQKVQEKLRMSDFCKIERAILSSKARSHMLNIVTIILISQ